MSIFAPADTLLAHDIRSATVHLPRETKPLFLLAALWDIRLALPYWSSLNFNDDTESLGIIICVLRQVHLDVVTPDENEALVLLRSCIKKRLDERERCLMSSS